MAGPSGAIGRSGPAAAVLSPAEALPALPDVFGEWLVIWPRRAEPRCRLPVSLTTPNDTGVARSVACTAASKACPAGGGAGCGGAHGQPTAPASGTEWSALAGLAGLAHTAGCVTERADQAPRSARVTGLAER